MRDLILQLSKSSIYSTKPFATAWLLQNKVLLPGATTLVRLISEIRERANQRLWKKLAALPNKWQAAQVMELLVILNRPGFPGECFICELRLPDHRFRWKHNKLFLLLPEEYGPAFPAIVDCYTSPPT